MYTRQPFKGTLANPAPSFSKIFMAFTHLQMNARVSDTFRDCGCRGRRGCRGCRAQPSVAIWPAWQCICRAEQAHDKQHGCCCYSCSGGHFWVRRRECQWFYSFLEVLVTDSVNLLLSFSPHTTALKSGLGGWGLNTNRWHGYKGSLLWSDSTEFKVEDRLVQR